MSYAEAIAAGVGLILAVGMSVLGQWCVTLSRRIALLEHQARCKHCWHWQMTSTKNLRTYQTCCHCGRTLALFGGERTHDPRTHGPYVIKSPGLEVVYTPASPAAPRIESP